MHRFVALRVAMSSSTTGVGGLYLVLQAEQLARRFIVQSYATHMAA